MAKVNVSISDALLDEVDEMAAALNRSRSGLVQEATAQYMTRLKEERASEERRRSIAEAMVGAQDIATRVPSGDDATDIIRRDRDSDHGNAGSDD